MTDSPPPYEKEWKERLNNLQHQMVVYEEVQQAGDDKATEAEARKVAAAMRGVGDGQADPKVKKDWYKKSEKFLRSTKSMRRGIIGEVAGIVIGLISIPLHVVGGALSVVGGIVNGVSSVLIGVGDSLSGGPSRARENIHGDNYSRGEGSSRDKGRYS